VSRNAVETSKNDNLGYKKPTIVAPITRLPRAFFSFSYGSQRTCSDKCEHKYRAIRDIAVMDEIAPHRDCESSAQSETEADAWCAIGGFAGRL
jgi:hypothetical protein